MGFLSKSIKVDVYTNQQYAYDQCKPQLAKKYIPEWWKGLPASRPSHQAYYNDLPISSMKQCPAINDILKTGIIFPSWCELHMRVNEHGEKEVRVFPDFIPAIPHDERDFDFHKPGLAHVKLGSPWFIKETTGVKWVWIKTDWHTKNPLAYWGVPGITEYKYQHSVLNNIMVPYNSEVKIQVGDPWLQLIPMSEKPIDLNVHLVDSETMNNLNTVNISSVGSYLKTIRNISKQRKLDENN